MRSIAQAIRRRLRLIWGMLRIDIQERLGERRSLRLAKILRRFPGIRRRNNFDPLHKWERISESSYRSYTRDSNAARIQRLRELIPAGSRVLDIGIGYGYVTGIVLRDLMPAYYCGVDLRENYLDAARDMAAHNELDLTNTAFEILDVFDINREFTSRHKPDFVLVLEVLEHVKDPAGALRSLATALDPHTRILFTVPLRGRLDGVWGHYSVFGRKRLQGMCRYAGVSIERVEPLSNTWALVLAKVLRPEARPGNRDKDAGLSDFSNTFTEIEMSKPASTYRRQGDAEGRVEIKPSRTGIRCKVRPAEDGEGGGIRVPISDPKVTRIELTVEPTDRLRHVAISGIDDSGEAQYSWATPPIIKADFGRRTTYVLRPGQSSRSLRPSYTGNSRGVRWLDLCVQPTDSEITFTLHRAAYLPEP